MRMFQVIWKIFDPIQIQKGIYTQFTNIFNSKHVVRLLGLTLVQSHTRFNVNLFFLALIIVL